MKIEKEKMIKAFNAAKEAAAKADPGNGLENDGGTCNFDSPQFYAKGARATTIEAIAKECGLSTMKLSGWHRGWYCLLGLTFGQGQRRTTMAEAATRALKDSGLAASTYYQMD